jgi:hypothetical protein
MAYIVGRCIVCGQREIKSGTSGRYVLMSCNGCDADFQIEFDPPDAPEIRGRIEILSPGRYPVPETLMTCPAFVGPPEA